jgi:hypothetical protein
LAAKATIVILQAYPDIILEKRLGIFLNVKVILVRGHGGTLGFETSKFPHFLDSQLTVGGEVVSLKQRPPFAPMNIPGTHFC